MRSKVLLRGLFFSGLCAFMLGLTQPAQAIVILSNLPGAGSPGTSLGVGIDGRVRLKAVGLTVGANDLSFTSMSGLFRNPNNVPRSVNGGIFSDVGGDPGVQLVAFNPVPIAAGAFDMLQTLTAVSAFTLMANTSYWFVLGGPAVENEMSWSGLAPDTAPTPSGEVFSFDGYNFSITGGATWVDTGVIFNSVEIEASLITDLPEPGTLAVFALGLLGLGVACRRQRA